MATDNEITRIGVCRFCGQKMMTAKSVNNVTNISRLRVCRNPNCGKDMYMTREIHPDRFAFLEKCEQQRWALAHAQVSERKQSVIEHSYEQALTPVETPSQAAAREAELDDMMRKLAPVEPPPFPFTPRELIQKQRGRRYDALRAEGLSQADAGKKVDAETDEEVATWDAEAEFARNVAQNLKYNVLKKRYDNNEIDFDEFERLKLELDEG